MRYNCYHKHTHYSNIMTPDCIVKPLDYAKRAKELGHTSICTTEHGYAGNIFEYYDIAQEQNLKLVFGIEYYYVNDRLEKDRSNSHLMILAKNNSGMKQMTKIMSEANKTGYYYKPRIDKELLFSLDPNDVVVTSTCVISYINKHDDYEENFIKPILEHFKDNFYLEIHDNTHPMQVKYNQVILELHKRYGISFIHATDSHYIHPEEDKDRTEFLNGKNIYYPEEDGFILDYPDSETIFKRYEQQGVFTREQVEQGLRNTLIIDHFEDIVLDKEIKMPSIYPEQSHKEKVSKLKQIINEEWKKDRVEVPKEKHCEYIDAIRSETQIIEDTQMEDYFLLNYEIIKRAKDKGGVLTRTGRGSAPSFYVNKLLGFTEIDRLSAPITLYPTRFISTSRILETKSLPDIDFNTANPEPFIEAAKEILGEDNVYYMTAYGTMQESEAFRNLCRAKGLQMNDYNDAAKDIDSHKNDPKWKEIIEESSKFIGVIDSVSPHPCAFLLLSRPISEEVGVIRVGNKDNLTYCALIDSDTSDSWKYLKNDFLTVTVWQIISEGYEQINKPIANIRELSRLVENDEKVWSLYEDGITATLNQTGTESGTPQVMQYKPKNIRELSAWVSAIRPSFASMKHVFLNRKSFNYGIPEFDAILEESDNFVLYQENIMATLVYTGFPEDETYGLLKAIAKKKPGIIEPIYERFIDGFVAKTGSKEKAEKVWKIIEDAVGYGFNSSHAYAVALDSVYGAYLKANYPLEYYSVVLNKYEGNPKMTAKIFKELPYFEIKVKTVKFRLSKSKYSPDKKSNSIYKGIASIKFLSSQVADDLYELGSNTYDCFLDLLIDIDTNTSCNSKQTEILIKLNFFEEFGKNKTLLDIYTKFKERYKKSHTDVTKQKRITEINEFISALGEEESLPASEQILLERFYLGYAETKFTEVDDTYALVLDIDKKYTPKITFYILNKGIEVIHKISKQEFYQGSTELLTTGDIVKILKLEEKKKKRLVEGKWTEMDDKETWIGSLAIVRKHVENKLK